MFGHSGKECDAAITRESAPPEIEQFHKIDRMFGCPVCSPKEPTALPGALPAGTGSAIGDPAAQTSSSARAAHHMAKPRIPSLTVDFAKPILRTKRFPSGVWANFR